MAELGNTLSRARRARGISLEDAERDTHVSRRYLQALESEDFTIFPAPVYARGFLRTYSRYLGLNPEELLRVFPSGDLALDMAPLPTVSRPPSRMINVNWVVAGLVMVFLLGAALLLLRGSGDPTVVGNSPTGSSPTVPVGATSPSASPPGSAAAQPTQGKVISPATPGQLPDFVGADIASAMAILRENQMSYALIEVANRPTPKGIIYGQTPSAGSKSEANTTITLYVSGGPTAAQ